MSHVATITIDHTKVAGDLTDYVVLVVPDSDAGWDALYALATEDGGDIRCFKSDDTTELAREIVSFSVSAETGEIYIKYTGTTSSTVDTDIHIYCDGVADDYAVTDTYGRNAVWSSERAVFHMNNVNDSTANGLNLTNNNTVTFSSGKIKNTADTSTGNTNKNLSQNTEFINNSQMTSGWSFRQWINFNTLPATGDSDLRWLSYFAASAGGSTRKVVSIAYDGRVTNQGFRVRIEGSSTTFLNAGNATSASTWVKYDVQYTGSNIEVYINGSRIINTAHTFTNQSFAAPTPRIDIFGITGYSQSFVSGKIDEVRVKNNGSYSENYLSTDYQNQNSPSTFYSVTAITSEIPQAITGSLISTGLINFDLDLNRTLSGSLISTGSMELTRILSRTLSGTVVASSEITNIKSKFVELLGNIVSTSTINKAGSYSRSLVGNMDILSSIATILPFALWTPVAKDDDPDAWTPVDRQL